MITKFQWMNAWRGSVKCTLRLSFDVGVLNHFLDYYLIVWRTIIAKWFMDWWSVFSWGS